MDKGRKFSFIILPVIAFIFLSSIFYSEDVETTGYGQEEAEEQIIVDQEGYNLLQ